MVTIGFTFSCGLIDFLVFGVLQGNSKTHWVFIIVGGVMYFFLYYFSFRFLIKKFDLKTPGREDDNILTIFNKKKMDYSFDQSLLDPQVQMIIKEPSLTRLGSCKEARNRVIQQSRSLKLYLPPSPLIIICR